MFPKYDEIQVPLLRELARRGGQSGPSDIGPNGKDVYEVLADHFELSEEARDAAISESGRSKWKNMVRWARNDLKKAGYLDAPRRGVWAVSEKGWEILDEAEVEEAGRGVFAGGKVMEPEAFEQSQKEAERIGDIGEEYALSYEKRKLKRRGQHELAREVRRVSLENVAAGYDMLSFGKSGDEKYVEVKSSKSYYTKFELTENELRTAERCRSSYWIYRIRGVEADSPDVTEIQDPAGLIENDILLLKPTAYSVTVGEDFGG